MFNVKLSLKLITTCPVSASNLDGFIKKINKGGLYTFIEDFDDKTTYDSDDEFDVMIFELVQEQA